MAVKVWFWFTNGCTYWFELSHFKSMFRLLINSTLLENTYIYLVLRKENVIYIIIVYELQYSTSDQSIFLDTNRWLVIFFDIRDLTKEERETTIMPLFGIEKITDERWRLISGALFPNKLRIYSMYAIVYLILDNIF